MQKQDPRHERWALIAGAMALIVGIVGSVLFYDAFVTVAPIGLGYPILVGVLLLAIAIVTTTMHIPFRLSVWWLMLPILFFSGMIAVRAESTLVMLNIVLSLALGGLLLHYLPLDKAPHQQNTFEHVMAIMVTSTYALFGTFVELSWVQKALRSIQWTGNKRTKAVLRGVGLAVPILLVFGVLLASADTVFSDALSGIFGGFTNVGDLLGHLFFMMVLAWLALGLLGYGAHAPYLTPQKPSDDHATDSTNDEADFTPAPEKPKGLPSLGMIETSIVMGSVIALFAVFVLIQFTYLFGGQANIRDGVTFAQYARRGFFELVVVAVLVIALGRYLHVQTRRQGARATGLFRIESVVLIGLTLVLLASAWYRMNLYESAYGFTQLRLYVYVFMLALGALMGFFLLEVFTHSKTIFSLGILLTVIGYGVALNGIGGEAFIAERNVQRYAQGADLDICYLKTFSVDALPQMLTLLDVTKQNGDEEVQLEVEDWLRQQDNDLQVDAQMGLLTTFNVSRRNAQTRFESLPTFPAIDWGSATVEYCY